MITNQRYFLFKNMNPRRVKKKCVLHPWTGTCNYFTIQFDINIVILFLYFVFLSSGKTMDFVSDDVTEQTKQVFWTKVCLIQSTPHFLWKEFQFYLIFCPYWQYCLLRLTFINPLSPTSDQDRISPYTICSILSRKVMRIKKNINWGIICWSNSKFSKLTSYELYDRQ